MVIEDGKGSTDRERVEAGDCSTTVCSYTYYHLPGSRGELGVSVETGGCVTRQTVCQERPVCEQTTSHSSSPLNHTSFLMYQQIVH